MIIRDRTWTPNHDLDGGTYDLDCLTDQPKEDPPLFEDACLAIAEADDAKYMGVDSALYLPATKGRSYFHNELQTLHQDSERLLEEQKEEAKVWGALMPFGTDSESDNGYQPARKRKRVSVNARLAIYLTISSPRTAPRDPVKLVKGIVATKMKTLRWRNLTTAVNDQAVELMARLLYIIHFCIRRLVQLCLRNSRIECLVGKNVTKIV